MEAFGLLGMSAVSWCSMTYFVFRVFRCLVPKPVFRTFRHRWKPKLVSVVSALTSIVHVRLHARQRRQQVGASIDYRGVRNIG